MASISTLGVGSGLDLSSILDSLEAAEKSTLTPISKQQSSYTAKLSAYGTLKSALESFQTANTALNKADLFTATSTTSSSSAFSATTTGSAIAGKYTISVSQLAQAQTLTTKNSQKDSKAAIATSDSVLTIQQGGGKDPVTIDISAGNSSLSGIRDAINNAKAGVSASIINVGNGEYRLSITANDTGSNNAMKLSVSGDSALESFMGYNGTPGDSSNGMIESVTAQNAKLTVNNVEIENSSNTISDSLEDITLNLNDVTTGNQTLTISKDTSKAENAVKAWVAVQQILIGIALGFTMQFAFAAVRTAGEIIGLQMGLSFATFVDPASHLNMPVLARIMDMLALLLFLTFNGHLWLISLLADTFHTLPIGGEPLNSNAFLALTKAGSLIFLNGLMLALPLITLLLTLNLALGLLNRMAPQLSIFVIGFPLTLTVGISLMAALMPLIAPFCEHLFSEMFNLLADIISELPLI